MKKLIYFFTIIGAFYSFNSFSQVPLYTADAVRFSQTDGGGTARFVGLGGANVSLGGDISSISGNPAGLGFYNRSTWAISPVLRIGEFSAQYEGENSRNMGGNFQIPNMGMVFHNRFEEYAGSKWISGTFGVAINQKQSFYNNINYSGTIDLNADGFPYDFVEYMASPFLITDDQGNVFNKRYATEEEIEPDFLSNPYSNLASFVGLLNIIEIVDENDNVIGYEVDRYDINQLSPARQQENITTYSGLTTLDLSYGANYNDVLFLGAALNINFLNYRQERQFRETPNNGILNYMELNEETTISGAGAAFTFGAIYKPINILNIGFSYTSPTFISITETQEIDMTAIFLDGSGGNEGLINEVDPYSIMIPQKVSVGATAFLSKYGFLTADLEYVDYASTRYSSSNGAFGGEIPDVGGDLESTFNLKVGAEGRWNILRARVGYTYFDNPYNLNLGTNSSNFNQDRQSISGGIGIMRKNGFFADVTYKLSSFNNPDFTAYPGSDIIKSQSNISSLRLTIGKSF
ncbi:hypothetical protein [Marivirga sp.]|uniref:hypothetical protein n=1 Tax=Marivirga sp. TaxID=2018662 RepID=UPI002D7FE8A9|nr:hypothetical protein [Marivirga sp.]HET8860158.1 hypothetical protein [Marivirga sp.]